ncbi:MAG: metallophosphoesterase [Thermoprotei archaeon]|nr:MAG: metallophosphoesterase [Thermoprotei archaeon]RLF23368.1 MAG: metallophosphoesterase [Thermoprotei archaeon]
MQKFVIAATADIHSPKYLTDFIKALDRTPLSDCVAFIIAGDVVYKGNVGAASHVFSAIRRRYKGPLIVVFGNEDYEDLEDRFRKLYPEVIWLSDEYHDLKTNDQVIRIIGTRGVLDRPTRWQAKNIPDIEKRYSDRLMKLEDMLKRSPHPTILVSHYSVTYRTLSGEDRRIWPELGSRKVEVLISRYKPILAIHAHAHRSKVFSIDFNGVPIYNVSFAAFKRIFRIEVSLKRGILSFI